MNEIFQMKFVRSNGGQLCNRIWSYTYWIAYSIQYDEHIFIIDFQEYIPLFSNLNKFKKIHFIKSKKLRSLIETVLPKNKTIQNSGKYEALKNRNFLLLDGWEWRNETTLINKYKNELLKLFLPKQHFIINCNSTIQKHKNSKTLIGVHIRRKDYNSFFNGIYYYDNCMYRKFMEETIHSLSTIVNTGFRYFLCSDDEIDPNDFLPFDCFKIPDATNIEDLYSLSLCDYIIGPPSTFSMWASFYGNVPLKIIDHPDAKFSVDDFKIISAVDRFTDGSFFTHVTGNG